MSVAEPFGAADVLRISSNVWPATPEPATSRTRWSRSIRALAPSRTASGNTLGYDALLIALGANPVEAVPGALTFSGEEERHRFAELLTTLGRRGTKRLAFVVPRAASWSIAAYELALLTAAERDARRLEGVEITLVTHEAAPLDLFGAPASQLVAARLEEAGISVRLSSLVDRFEEGQLHLQAEGSVTVDAAVALPGARGTAATGAPSAAERIRAYRHRHARRRA